ncbi:uncharacterized protein G2W53_044516 [Senna tora]|uniref:Uncharacterized protein n=1 Tax=Senna tora TaxID=362788 RepID=A0A834SEK2_9FABA|nr:uncharacterized protein G2W53_044516 [Senna tora]
MRQEWKGYRIARVVNPEPSKRQEWKGYHVRSESLSRHD